MWHLVVIFLVCKLSEEDIVPADVADEEEEDSVVSSEYRSLQRRSFWSGATVAGVNMETTWEHNTDNIYMILQYGIE